MGKNTKDDFLLEQYFLDVRNRLKQDGLGEEERLVLENFLLVVSIAQRYCPKGFEHRLPDLIQEGNIGLIEAIRAFDKNRGVKLSTFASTYIRGRIYRYAIDSIGVIRVSDSVTRRAKRLNDFITRFYSKYDREPTDKEIMAAVKIDALSTIEKIEMRVNPSLDDNVDQLEFGQYLVDVNSLDPSEYLEFLDILDQLRLELNNLSEPQRLAIDLRFGISSRGEELKLEEIGKILCIVKDAVRQRIFHGLRKLRRRIENKTRLPNPVIK